MNREDLNARDRNKLIPLDEIDDLEVADHDPDVRGWDVYGADGTKIGEVEQLIVNPAEMKVRYLDVELDDKVHEMRASSKDDDDRHVLIPIGRATIDEDQDRVIIQGVQLSGLRDFPSYTGDISREYEDKVIHCFDKSGNAEQPLIQQRTNVEGNSYQALPPTAKHNEEHIPDEFYNRKDFDENEFYGSRRKRTNSENNNNALRRRND